MPTPTILFITIILDTKIEAFSSGSNIMEIKEPTAKLLDVDFHIDRLFHRDREQADIEPKTTDGKLSFTVSDIPSALWLSRPGRR